MKPPQVSILMVDDQPENLVALEAVLEPLGHRLVKAGSGREALRRVLTEDFAVILMDVQMPGMDGFETAAHIKRRERSRHIPIVFLTALSKSAEQAFRGYEAGAVDYILKPFDPEVLRSKVAVFVDLHRLKRRAEDLAHRAVHDPLTGLPNRVLFMDRLEVALARTERRPARVAVLFFDLDGFKLVNDTLGHEAGDQLLAQVAERVRHVVRPTDTVARFGGDEFTVMAEVADEQEVMDIAERISATIASPFTVESAEAFVSASIGIAVASGPGDNPDTLIREADAAMYRAKQQGGARRELYDAAMRRRAHRRIETENALRRAIERDEFRLAYQPCVHLRTGTVVGVEALLRWEHPELGLIRPEDFLSLAEETALIVPIGNWVLNEALRQGARWRAAHPDLPPLTISVNLSARQLGRPDFVSTVTQALGDTATDPDLLCLEVTESAVVEDAKATMVALKELRAQGVELALDDFGTGYSSLSYLRRFPVDKLKVDRSFVAALGERSSDSSIVAAVVDLAHALRLQAVAEGVETREQLVELQRLGCDLGQGNLLAEPRSAETILDPFTAEPVVKAATAASASRSDGDGSGEGELAGGRGAGGGDGRPGGELASRGNGLTGAQASARSPA